MVGPHPGSTHRRCPTLTPRYPRAAERGSKLTTMELPGGVNTRPGNLHASSRRTAEFHAVSLRSRVDTSMCGVNRRSSFQWLKKRSGSG